MTQRESLKQSITQELPLQPKSLRKYRVGMYLCGSCTVLFVVLACISALVLGKIITAQAKAGVVMTASTEGLWAHVPGETETVIIREYTFFNFTNPKEFLYKGARPVFREVSGFQIQELSDMENIRYTEDGNNVQFDYWLHFGEVANRNMSDKVKILNLGPLGFWAQVQKAPDQNFTLNGLGPLFLELKNTLKTTVLGQGVCAQYLPDEASFQTLARTAELSKEQAQFLWNDKRHGLSDPDNSEVWVLASQFGIGSNESNFLQNYFLIQSVQMQTILTTMNDWSSSLQLLIGNWYCGDPSECTSEEMLYMQLSSSYITQNPPLGKEPIESICSSNATCIGYPQINNYLEKVFKKEYPDRKECFDVKFSNTTFRKLFNPTTQPYCLLNSGNLNKLFEYGKAYDTTNSSEMLGKIKVQFQMDSDQHTIVFWNWIKYFTYQFVIKQSRNGSKAIAGIGGVASQALYQSISSASGWLLNLLLSTKVANKIQTKYSSCIMFISSTVDNLTYEQLASICDSIDLSVPASLIPVINVCKYAYSAQWLEFMANNSLNYLHMAQICDQDEPSIKTYIDMAQMDLESEYNCGYTPEIGCSEFQIGYKQWNQSLITRNPIPELDLLPAWTANLWNPDLPAFEYSYYLYFMESESKFRPDILQVVDLLSFDKLYSGPMIQELFNLNSSDFKEQFYWDDKNLLEEYIRFVVIQIGLGGITQDRTANQMLFGYNDPFLEVLTKMDPIVGGDPSASSIVAINEPNCTRQEAVGYPQSMFTGKNDTSLTRFYSSINGQNTITLNYSYWNGKEVVKALRSPWAEEDHFIGTDAVMCSPGIKVGDPNMNLSIYITDLYRYGSAKYNQTVERFGMQVVMARIPPEMFESKYQREQNSIYYQQYHGFTNQTAVVGLPLFISRNHFLGAGKNWSDLVDIYDQSGQHILNASIYDETYIQLEPNTGASFCAAIYLQTNVEFKQDDLFSRKGLVMLPIFTLWRSGNISSGSVDKYFGPLRLALSIKKKSTFIMIGMVGLCLMLTLTIVMCYRRASKDHRKMQSIITDGGE